MTERDDNDPRTWPVDLSPDEPTVISQAPFLAAFRLERAGLDESIHEGGWGVTPNGWRWQRRDGLFHSLDGWTEDELAHPDDYADLGWSREHVETAYGPLSPEATSEQAELRVAYKAAVEACGTLQDDLDALRVTVARVRAALFQGGQTPTIRWRNAVLALEEVKS